MNAAPQPTPYIPYHRNPYFTGREYILHYLYTHLHITDNTKEVSSYALSGLGGIGKTQTIIEYAYQYAQEYSAVFWIGAESHESRIASLQRIAECLRLPEEQECHKMIAAVINWLNSHRNWLLLVDNAVVLNNLAKFYYNLSRYEETHNAFSRSLSIWEETVGPVHAYVTHALLGLAQVAHKRKQHQEAESCHRRAYDIVKELFHDKHPQFLAVQSSFQEFYKEQGHPDKAKALAFEEYSHAVVS
ncbi:tetratricopeptide repeat protein [Thermosporothrix hazakensis]|jgi:tetratricopeptide (TPR) repeat protein|uniref:Tetratricopeptide repeat protein n=1 Tax=Thermosporothrix hazakensis TaxID=644383 RepID=A0A326TT26_THEHA|nr:tetratricopeptide repeat protein [Thermosporothrix hazakensis]PZW19220.1 tetratricopeptide repeat protein [Thermosporothrix hazakensis]GCE45148.1 hypothetical protein KTH_00170 [Thermosporothrix hazakensis]